MKNKKYKVEIPEGYEVIETVEHRYREAFPNDSNEHITHITVNLKKSKKELPKSWEEYLRIENKCRPTIGNLIIRPKYQEAFKALGKLIELRDHYNDGWEPDWKNEDIKYHIFYRNDKIVTGESRHENEVLSFKSKEIRNEFFSNFRELIQTAKPLL